jgi:hypothetical protein
MARPEEDRGKRGLPGSHHGRARASSGLARPSRHFGTSGRNRSEESASEGRPRRDSTSAGQLKRRTRGSSSGGSRGGAGGSTVSSKTTRRAAPIDRGVGARPQPGSRANASSPSRARTSRGEEPWSQAKRPQRRAGSPPMVRRSPARTKDPQRAPRNWGSVARRGAGNLSRSIEPESRERLKPGQRRAPIASTTRPGARFRVSGSGFEAARPASATRERETRTKRARTPRSSVVPKNVRSEIATVVAPREVPRIASRLESAARAYEEDRYSDAQTILRQLARLAPGLPTVRELLGLTLYRRGEWRGALRELRKFTDMTGSVEQLPVIADCERALGHYERVAELWTEIRQAGVPSDVLVEGRLVTAGSLADQGRLKDAIRLLEAVASRKVRSPRPQDLRQWYMLADLYERSGDVPRAREMFKRVVAADPEVADAAQRLSGLG